jgi:predicted metal-binding membrane protein
VPAVPLTVTTWPVREQRCPGRSACPGDKHLAWFECVEIRHAGLAIGGYSGDEGLGLCVRAQPCHGHDVEHRIETAIAMAVAMMFPTSAPMILMFDRVQAGKRRQGAAFVPTWVFVGAYLIVWTAFGAPAFVVAVGAEKLGDQVPWLMDNAARIGVAVLVLAGLYQLSPLKRACLTKCRSPLSFILNSWRDGRGGAFRMGSSTGCIASAAAGFCSSSFSRSA